MRQNACGVMIRRGSSDGHNGLGLWFAAQVVTTHGGQLELKTANPAAWLSLSSAGINKNPIPAATSFPLLIMYAKINPSTLYIPPYLFFILPVGIPEFTNDTIVLLKE